MSTKLKGRNVNKTVTGSVHHIQYTSSFELPVLNMWKTYFINVCKHVQSIPYVLRVYISDIPQLCVTTKDKDTMNYVASIMQKEIKIFIDRQQPSKAKKQRLATPSKSLQSRKLIAGYVRLSTAIKKKKINRKKWYNFDKKLKRTTTILKYTRQEIKYHRRHHFVSLYQQQKRSSNEYRQKNIIGRRRDRLKEFQSHLNKRRKLSLYKHTATCGSHTKSNNIPVLKYGNRAKWRTELLLSSYFHFPGTAFTSALSLTSNNNKILFRYSNQHIFMYAKTVNHCNRPSNKYLISIFSTINGNQLGVSNQQQASVAPARRAKSLTKSVLCNKIPCQRAQAEKQKSKKQLKKNC